MSDYLSNLVSRTLSPKAGVRPQLRSAFEPAPLHHGSTGPADFKLETPVESNPPASLPLTAPTPFASVPSRAPPNAAPTISPTRDELPRQVVPPPGPPSIRGRRPPLNSNENEDTATVQPLQPTDREPSLKPTALQRVMHPSPDAAFENSQAVPTPAATQRRESVPAPRPQPAAQAFDTVHPVARMVPPQTVESKESRSERIGLVAIRSVAPAATVLSPSPSVAPTSDTPRSTAEAIRGQTVESEEPRSDRIDLVAIRSVPPAATVLSPSPSVAPTSDPPRPAAAIQSQTVESEERRSVRFAVAAIRPVTPAVPVFSPSLPPVVAPPPPTIHVTIGRVEVRATPPPPGGSRAKAALPPVMSLEEYLGRRGAGGQR